jgi:hypothetical protein
MGYAVSAYKIDIGHIVTNDDLEEESLAIARRRWALA